jgi:threonine/homoserine/homoserine lactone efflux protein
VGLSAEALVLLALLTISPGPDTILTLRQSLTAGVSLALWTAAGISTGTVVHSALSGAGLAVLLQRVPAAYRVVQALGVAYLCYLGVRSLWSAWRDRAGSAAPDPPSRRGGYRDGLATNLLNPKVALFYLGFLPQFIPPGPGFLPTAVLYGLAHAAMGMAWLGLVALGADRLRGHVTRPGFRTATETLCGLALLGFAVRLAL